MKDLESTLGAVLARIAGFFDILDLSFLVAGTLSLAALFFLTTSLGIALPSLPGGWFAVLVTLVLVYGSGLAAFVVGRWLRAAYNRRLWTRESPLDGGRVLPDILRAHGLDGDPRFAPYLTGSADDALRRPWRLYTRLWAELRHDSTRAASLALVLRYWVMCATCDGLASAAILWAAVLAGIAYGGLPPLGGSPMLGLMALPLLVVAVLMVREANRYLCYQHEELVASLAAGVTVAPSLPKPDQGGGAPT